MFRIGEFSKIAQIPGSQLRYYDEIGLLKPARIDSLTGYRYYSARQLPDLNRILALKELGLSLDQIRRMLAGAVSAEEIRGMLSLKKAQIEQSVRDELERIRHIEARLHQIESGGGLHDFDIVVKSVPEQHYLSAREVFPSFGAAQLMMLEMQRALPGRVDKNQIGHFTAIMHSDMYEYEGIELEMGVVLNEPLDVTVPLPGDQLMGVRTLPAVTEMVTSVRVGAPNEAYDCRGALATWMESNGYIFSGTGREVFIVPPCPGREQETVMEIQFPISKGDPAALPHP